MSLHDGELVKRRTVQHDIPVPLLNGHNDGICDKVIVHNAHGARPIALERQAEIIRRDLFDADRPAHRIGKIGLTRRKERLAVLCDQPSVLEYRLHAEGCNVLNGDEVGVIPGRDRTPAL